jgi:hypothetical protein
MAGCLPVCLSVCPSVLQSAWNNLVPNGGFPWKFIFEFFFRKSVKKALFIIIGEELLVLYTRTATHIYYISLNTSYTRNVSGTSCKENQNTHFVFNIIFFFYKNRALCNIMWKTMLQPDRPQKTI